MASCTTSDPLGLSPDRTEDLELAVSEAVTNAIEHGNKGEGHKLVAAEFALAPDKLEIKIADLRKRRTTD